MDRIIVDYKGQRVHIRCADEDVPSVVYETLVAPFLSDFEYSWLSGTRAEERAKHYLDYIAGLMIRRPKDHNVLAPRQMRKVRGMELTLGATDTSPQHVQPAPAKPRKRRSADTKDSRLNAIRAMYPRCGITYCRIDTDNCFSYNGESFIVHSDVKVYAPKMTSIGTFYAMDKGGVVDSGGELHFYDQEIRPIGAANVVRKRNTSNL